MAKKQPGTMLYFDIRPSLKRLSLEEKGRLFEAILDYGEFGLVPELDSAALGVAWDFIQPRLDRDRERYGEQVLQRNYAAYSRETKRRGDTPLSFDRWKLSMATSDNESLRGATSDNESYPTTTPTPTSSSSSTTTSTATTPAGKPRGKYGRVLLTDEELESLRVDYGAALVSAAINYLDMYIQEKGYASQDHGIAIRRWVIDAVKAKPLRKSEPDPQRVKEETMLSIKALGNDPELAARAEELRKMLCREE